ncbi:MAG: hypothetical protein JWN94_65 [Betaproteobacteria bacterium]|nr:hypothetical protein [Betaproteobacteria bacterium]
MAEAIPRLQRSPAMNTLRSHEESDPILSPRSATDPLFHQCPVCGTLHEVNAVRAQFAYGRQLSCSPDCEAERRRRIRAAYRCAPSLVRSEALVEFCSVAGPVRAAEKSVPLKLMISEAAHSGASMKQAGALEATAQQRTVIAESGILPRSALIQQRSRANAKPSFQPLSNRATSCRCAGRFFRLAVSPSASSKPRRYLTVRKSVYLSACGAARSIRS